MYRAERALLEGFRVIPLFHLPDVYGVGPRVKGGPGISPLGEWRFENLWLEGAPAMTFRTRLLLIFTRGRGRLGRAGGSGWSSTTRGRPSNAWRRQRVDALVAQFRQGIRPAPAGGRARGEGHRRFRCRDQHRHRARPGAVLQRGCRPGRRAQPGPAGTGGGRWRHHLLGGMAGALRVQRRLADERAKTGGRAGLSCSARNCRTA